MINPIDSLRNLLVKPEPEPSGEEWAPNVDESLPKDIRDAIVDTARLDRERQHRAKAMRQRDDMLNSRLYNVSRDNFGGHQGTASPAMETQRRIEEQYRNIMNNSSGLIDQNMWSEKLLEEYQRAVLSGPIITRTPREEEWRHVMNGEFKDYGVVRINFPFGQVEMDVRNEPELERMVDMVKHMLKVHEENQAANALRREMNEGADNSSATINVSKPSVFGQSIPPPHTSSI